jgi:hypothetical protein
MKRLLYHNIQCPFNRADILRRENGCGCQKTASSSVDDARRRYAIKLFAARQAVALLLPGIAITLGEGVALCGLMVHRFLSSR